MTPGLDVDAARFFQALGDPTRLALLEVLRGGERNVGELVTALGCPQPKVSRHLKVLKDAGLVRDTREGRNVAYALTPPRAWPVAARSWVERLETGLPLREVAAAGRERLTAGRAAPRSEAPGKAPAPPPPDGKPAARPARGQLESHLL